MILSIELQNFDMFILPPSVTCKQYLETWMYDISNNLMIYRAIETEIVYTIANHVWKYTDA